MPYPKRDIIRCRGECQQELPRDAFYRRKSGKGAGQPVQPCIECQKARGRTEAGRDAKRESSRKTRAADPTAAKYANRKSVLSAYRMTPEEYDERLEEQGGGCAICGRAPEKKALSNDHNKKCCPEPANKKKTCGECNRGLLCQPCNIAIGLMDDDIERLQSAIEYLRRHQ